jgi:hypothetical protein
MEFNTLNDKNFLLFASKYYDNPRCESIDEFHEDLNRIKYIKRLLKKYKKTGVLRERLLLNHIIILQNIFGPIPCCRILFFKLEKELHSELKTFLIYLNYLPDVLPETEVDEIPLDNKIITTLRKI